MKDQRQEAGDNAQQYLANRDINIFYVQVHLTDAQVREIVDQRVTEAVAGEIANEVTQEVVQLGGSLLEIEARALVHRAYFVPQSPWHYFMKVVNLSPNREIEITHIWFDTNPRVDILNPDRALPTRLRPYETFETWVPVASLPDVPNMEQLGRVLLSGGQIVKSQLNKDVPPVGYVAGPGSR